MVECVGFPLPTPGNWFAIDTEGTGLDPWGTYKVDRPHFPARPFAFSLANADGKTAYIRWQIDPTTRQVIKDQRSFDQLQELLGNEALTKVFHNCSYDRRMLSLTGFTIRGPLFDTIIGMHVLNPDEMTYQLKPLCKKYFGISDKDQNDLEDATKTIRQQVRRIQKIGAAHPMLHWRIADDEWFGNEPWMADYAFGPADLCRKYALQDAIRTATLYEAELKGLDEDEAEGGKLWKVLHRELNLMEVIREMETRGIKIDVKRTKEVKKYYDDYLAEAQTHIDKNGGTNLNLKSPKQMCQKFFGERGLKPKRFSLREDGSPVPCPHCKVARKNEDGSFITEKKITKKGKLRNVKVTTSPGCKLCQGTGHSPKCDAEFLYDMAGHFETNPDGSDKYVIDDQLAHWLLNAGSAKHMLSSFIVPYLKLMTRDPDGSMILRPNYKQCGPITGRISCERPNMMNVASDSTGRKKAQVLYRPRECFGPRAGFTLYLPDYSQIEVWVFAFLSNDKLMQAPLLAGEDFHGGIATRVWGDKFDAKIAKAAKKKDPKTLTPLEKKHLAALKTYRNRSKLLMFCKLYGGGPAKVAELLGCSVEEAAGFIEEYESRLPGVKKFMKEMIGRARRTGYILNPFGRKYPIDRSFAYKATNYLVQGTSAEILKNAMLNVYALSQTAKYKGKMFLLLTIHDELVIEVHKTIDNAITRKDICTAMQQDHKMIGCPIAFKVGMKSAAERWSETRDIEDAA